MIRMTLGGIRNPRVPAPASEPMARFRLYPRANSSLKVIRPTVAAVAADEPEMAANMVQPRTLTCISRPGRKAAQGASPLKSDADKRVRKRISAMRMNSGNAISDSLVVVFQMLIASWRSMGMLRKISRPAMPTENSASDTHTPAPRKTTSSSIVTDMVAVTAHRRGSDFRAPDPALPRAAA